jgi:murein DD-endopeptidase MepM/ murein hydrolase activator NlpD
MLCKSFSSKNVCDNVAQCRIGSREFNQKTPVPPVVNPIPCPACVFFLQWKQMLRGCISLVLAVSFLGCASKKPKDERPWPPIYRTNAAYHRAGSFVEAPVEEKKPATPQAPEASRAPTLQQVEQAILAFQKQRMARGPSMDTAWAPFFETLFAYLDQPTQSLSFSPLIRARVAAEFELDFEARSEGGAPPELEEAVGMLLMRIDSRVRQLRAGAGKGPESRTGRKDGQLSWPLSYGLITSKFGTRKDPIHPDVTQFHSGVDLAAPPNEPVYAADDGVVVFAGWAGGFGRTVRIHHRGGRETLYGHLSTILAKEDWEVTRGEVIGLLGKSGRATGHHLHFGLYLDGEAVDPLEYLEAIPIGFSDSTPGILFGYDGELPE